jgi:predicted DNA-binding transcriptional regulator
MKKIKLGNQLSFLPVHSINILNMLIEHDKPLRIKEIQDVYGIYPQQVYFILCRLVEQKLVVKVTRGVDPYYCYVINKDCKDKYLYIINGIDSLKTKCLDINNKIDELIQNKKEG